MGNGPVRRIFLGNWPIARRLTLGFLLAGLIAGAAAGLAGLTRAQTLGTEAALYRQILTANQYLGTAQNNLLLMDPTLHNAIQDAQAGQNNDLAVATHALQVMEDQLNKALNHYSSEDLLTAQPQAQQVLAAAGEDGLPAIQEQLYASAQRTWTLYQQTQQQVLSLIASGTIKQADDYEHRQGEPTHSDAISALNSLLQFNRQLAEAVQTGVKQQDLQGALLSGLAALLAFLAVLLVGWLISRTILRPVRNLSHLTQLVARGNFDSRTQPITSDELGRVTQAVNGMLDTIVGLLYETQNQRDSLTSGAKQLEGNLRGIGAGDLRTQANVSSDAMGSLAHAFNLTFNRFRRFITHSQATVEQMETLTQQISKRSNVLSQSARLEAARFAHMGVAAEELANQMRQAQQGANAAIHSRQTAAQLIQAGRLAIQHETEQSHSPPVQTLTAKLTAEQLTQQSRRLNETVLQAEDIARRAARLLMTIEVQVGQVLESLPGLQMVIKELYTLSADVSAVARQMRQVTAEAEQALQMVMAESKGSHQEAGYPADGRLSAASELSQTLYKLEAVLAQQADQLNLVRAAVAHARTAEEISRNAKESGTFLQAAGADAQKLAQNAEALMEFDQRLLVSLTPFRLTEAPRLPLTKAPMPRPDEKVPMA